MLENSLEMGDVDKIQVAAAVMPKAHNTPVESFFFVFCFFFPSFCKVRVVLTGSKRRESNVSVVEVVSAVLTGTIWKRSDTLQGLFVFPVPCCFFS